MVIQDWCYLTSWWYPTSDWLSLFCVPSSFTVKLESYPCRTECYLDTVVATCKDWVVDFSRSGPHGRVLVAREVMCADARHLISVPLDSDQPAFKSKRSMKGQAARSQTRSQSWFEYAYFYIAYYDISYILSINHFQGMYIHIYTHTHTHKYIYIYVHPRM